MRSTSMCISYEDFPNNEIWIDVRYRKGSGAICFRKRVNIPCSMPDTILCHIDHMTYSQHIMENMLNPNLL